MKNEIVARVVGFFRTVPSYPAFVVPAFQLRGYDGVWAQLVEDSRISKFSLVCADNERAVNELVRSESNIGMMAWVGSQELFGFAFSEEDWHCEREISMANYLLENKKRLEKTPYVLTEAADFYLEFIRGSQIDDSFKGFTDDLVARSARAARAELMQIPEKIRSAWRIDVIVAGELSQADSAYIRKLSKEFGNINIIPLPQLMQWADTMPLENRERWFWQAMEDRFETVSHVAVVGRPNTAQELEYLGLVFAAARSRKVEMELFGSVSLLRDWMRRLRPNESEVDADRAYVARLFGLKESVQRKGFSPILSRRRP